METYKEGEVGYLYRFIYWCLEDPKKLEELHEYSTVRQFKDTPREVLEYLLFSFHTSPSGRGDYEYYDEYSILYNSPINRDTESKDYNADPYLFRFTEEDWNFIKKIIGSSKD